MPHSLLCPVRWPRKSTAGRLALLAVLLPATLCHPAKASPELALTLTQDGSTHHILRDGPVAAHLVLTPARFPDAPRLLIAFPAGNSGIAAWFGAPADGLRWSLPQDFTAFREYDRQGRVLHGIRGEIIAHASSLKADQTVMTSVRVLREVQTHRWQHSGPSAATSSTTPAARTWPQRLPEAFPVVRQLPDKPDTLRWERDRIDGAPGYALQIDVLDGKLHADGLITPRADNTPIRLRLSASSGERPLTPITSPVLAAAQTGPGAQLAKTLQFLTFREKWLAGSWRFNTFFGRDTLMSAGVLMPVISTESMAAALSGVLSRLSARGEVAHEEVNGEYRLIMEREHPGDSVAATGADYKMADADLMLAPLSAMWGLDDARGRAGIGGFLAMTGDCPDLGQGCEAQPPVHGQALVRNFLWVVGRATPLANAPAEPLRHLLGPKDRNDRISQWRDSENGLGSSGYYAFDVNTILMPAALDAIARWYDSGLLKPWMTAEDGARLAQARKLAGIWQRVVPPLFAVTRTAAEAQSELLAYASHLGLPAPSLSEKTPWHFNALALQRDGTPLAAMHSDEGLRLFLTDVPAAELDLILTSVSRPFPAGLMTDVGMLIVNPVFAGRAEWQSLTPGHYHGALVWPWQQALMIAGIDRQLRRGDLDAALQDRLRSFRQTLLTRYQAVPPETRALELWRWRYEGSASAGKFVAEAYREFEEANPLQLWSTLYLALPDHAGSQRQLQ